MCENQVRILVIFANPTGTGSLRLGAEDRTIRGSLYQGSTAGKVEVDICHAAHLHDVRRALLRSNYRLVQFSGHSDSSGLLFEDRSGQTQRVSFEVFGSFIQAHSPPIEGLILNACSTLERGKFLSFGIPYVIAMRSSIGDELAIEFSRGFYDAIASGKSIDFAFSEGIRCIQAVSVPNGDVPVLVKRDTLSKYPLQPHGIRSDEYDRWYRQLSNGELETIVDPSASVEINILVSVLKQVLRERQLSNVLAGRAEVVLWELITNVARHVGKNQAFVGLEINTRFLPLVVVSVGDYGPGYDIQEVVEGQVLQMKDGEPEHGLGRICRLSDHVLPATPSESSPFFTVYCTLYDLPWPGSLCDSYSWCETVILDYASPASIWFGEVRYPLWWRYEGSRVLVEKLAAIGMLNFALDNDIHQVFDIYLGHLRASTRPYLLYEVRGHGPTEGVGPPRRSSLATITETLETYLSDYFADKKVLLYSSWHVHATFLRAMSEKHDLDLCLSRVMLQRKLESLDKAI